MTLRRAVCSLQQVNLTDLRANALDDFVHETMTALALDHPEAYVAIARERRDAQRTDDIGATRRLNDLMGAHPATGG